MTDEDRLREFDAQQRNLRETIEVIGKAIESLREAKSLAPPTYESSIQTLRYELGEISMTLNEQLPDYTWKKAGAKHQIKTEDEDRLEYRPEEDND